MIFSAYRDLPHPDLGDNEVVALRLDYELTPSNGKLIGMYLDKVFVIRGKQEKEVDKTNALFWLSIAEYKLDRIEDEVRADFFDWLRCGAGEF